MPRKGNRCTTMVNFQLTPLEATALQAVVVHLWCGRGDSNPHALVRHKLLRLARLPVPPLPQFGRENDQ